MKTFLAIAGSFVAGFIIGKIYQAKKDEEYINDEVKQMREEYKQKMKDLDNTKSVDEKVKEGKESDVYLINDIVEDEEEKSDDLSSKTLAELKAIAKEKGVKGYSSMKKEELINALN